MQGILVLKRGPQPNNGPVSLAAATYNIYKTKLHSTDPYAIIQEGGIEVERELEKNEFGRSLQPCTNHYRAVYGARPRAQKLNAFKLCLVHSKPLLELNSDLH